MNYEKAVLTLDRNYCIGQIDPRLRGSFVEHLGRAVYDGLYQYVHGLYTTASKNSTSNTCLLETSGVLLAMSPSIALHLITPQVFPGCLAAVQPLVNELCALRTTKMHLLGVDSKSHTFPENWKTVWQEYIL